MSNWGFFSPAACIARSNSLVASVSHKKETSRLAAENERLRAKVADQGVMSSAIDKLMDECERLTARLEKADACIKQIAHDDLEFGGFKLSIQARRMMDAFLADQPSTGITD